VGSLLSLAGWVIVAIAIVVLWVFPRALFPSPDTNDAIGLANAEWPLILIIIAGASTAYVRSRGALIRTALGVFLVGAASGLVVGLIVFGNLSNDRFAPLLLFAPVFALLGLVGLVVAIATSGHRKVELLWGALYGLAAAAVFITWTLARGSRDWLLAPYGFDILALIPVLGGALVLLGIGPTVRRTPNG
jgi:hypothetical protein